MKKAEGKISAFFFKDLDAGYELFIKAAGMFKADKRWKEAGNAFMRAGDVATQQKNPGDACMSYTECAKCWKKCDLKGAEMAMNQAIQLNIEANRLIQAARLLKEWGEALEEDSQSDNALNAYKRAAQYFNAEDQNQMASGCQVKIASILTTLNRFDEASKAYEALGFKYLDGPLKHQAKEQFFRAFICGLAAIQPDNQMEACAAARDQLDTYMGADPYFRNTRESEACELLLTAVEESDEASFDEAVGNLNELRMLDDTKSHILLRIKHSLSDTR
jgi:alpha-soluble NSF attachment protein